MIRSGQWSVHRIVLMCRLCSNELEYVVVHVMNWPLITLYYMQFPHVIRRNKSKMAINNMFFFQGMGGQFNYWGLWLDSEYGLGECSESCTTFQNYTQLSVNKHFEIRNIEVWAVGEKPKNDDVSLL